MTQDSITLYLTETRAAMAAMSELEKTGRTAWSSRVLPATMRDHDGTTDHGFKVLITPIGQPSFWL